MAKVGLEALDAIQSGRQADAAWLASARQTLEHAGQARAEVEIAVVPTVAKLALAASQTDKLQTMSPADWSRSLDEQLKAEPRRRGGH